MWPFGAGVFLYVGWCSSCSKLESKWCEISFFRFLQCFIPVALPAIPISVQLMYRIINLEACTRWAPNISSILLDSVIPSVILLESVTVEPYDLWHNVLSNLSRPGLLLVQLCSISILNTRGFDDSLLMIYCDGSYDLFRCLGNIGQEWTIYTQSSQCSPLRPNTIGWESPAFIIPYMLCRPGRPVEPQFTPAALALGFFCMANAWNQSELCRT